MSLRRNGGRRAARPLVAIAAALLSACRAAEVANEECQIIQPPTVLADGLEETSGVAASAQFPGVIWTHNDSGGDAEVVAVRLSGEQLARVRIRGARARDWEDMALGPCPMGTCFYLADIGDGEARYPEVTLYRAPEPDPARLSAVTAERFAARYPDGPRDAEAIFVLPSGRVYLVTKGRAGSVEIYRFPEVLDSTAVVTLERVRPLAEGPQTLDLQVTGASASPSGDWVAIRSYKTLQIWRTDDLLDGATRPTLLVDLRPVQESQGEAVALLDNGTVILTSEGGFPGALGSMAVLRCPLAES